MKKSSILWIIATRAIGIIVFLLVVFFINILAMLINTPIFRMTVSFLNNNMLFIVGLGLVYMVSDIFWVQKFPFILPAPIFSAVAGIMTAAFIFDVLLLLDAFLGVWIFSFFKAFSWVIYILIGLIVVVAGYAKILTKRLKA